MPEPTQKSCRTLLDMEDGCNYAHSIGDLNTCLCDWRPGLASGFGLRIQALGLGSGFVYIRY